ncbi:MAG: tautomerase family protein [Candidatus Bathyarchaeia archaeon]
MIAENLDKSILGTFEKSLIMPIVHVYVWKGFSVEAKRKVIAGITRVFIELGVPAEAVEVIIHEVPKNSWGVGGELASEKLEHVQPP